MQIRNDAPRPSTALSRAHHGRRAGVLLIAALAAPLAGCASTSGAAAPPPAPLVPEAEKSAWPEAAPPESVVQAQFLTSASAIEPGGKFLLAVLFEITPEYRISWSNPGDVGNRTVVAFEVPEGFSVAPVQFPPPSRFELPGKLVNYGYTDETAVFAEVTAPAKLSETEAYRFDVKASWLACKDDCANEELNAWFELTAARNAPEPQLPERLERHYAALPQAFEMLPESSHAWAKENPSRPALTLEARDVEWRDFIPSDADQPKLLGVKPAGHTLSLKFESAASPKPLRGLAVAQVAGKTAFFDVNVPWPVE